MKKIIFFFIITVITQAAFTQRRGFTVLENPVLQIDSIHEYFWSDAGGNWVFNGNWTDPHIYLYTPTDGLVTEILVIDRATGENVKKELKSYDSEGLMISHIYLDWSGGDWLNTRRDLLQYDENGLTDDFVIQKWVNSSWQNVTRFTDYLYNNLNKVLEYTEQSWTAGGWEGFAINIRTYDEEGYPLEIINKFFNGVYRYRQVYTWLLDMNRAELVHQPWDEKTGDFRNGVKTTFVYNNCFQTQLEIRQQYMDGQWINYSKKEYFRSLVIDPDMMHQVKVPVCHNGHTIYIPYSALKAHLAHGDCVGECSLKNETSNCRTCNYKNDNWEPKNSKTDGNKKSAIASEEITGESSLSIYPNPFSNHTIVTLPEDHAYTTILVVDMQGRIVRNISLENQQEVTIQKDDLQSGVYFFRFMGYGGTTVQKVVVW